MKMRPKVMPHALPSSIRPQVITTEQKPVAFEMPSPSLRKVRASLKGTSLNTSSEL